jgi:hypothetical protein
MPEATVLLLNTTCGRRVARGSWLATGLTALGLAAAAGTPAPAGTVSDMVKALCRSAVQAELESAGKPAPEGMAEFACTCVADRISSGSSLDGARSTCRQQTAQRYPL